jgi:hypothetical protein
MTAPSPSLTFHRLLVFVATVWSLVQALFLIDSNFSRPKQFQESDYIMTFYVAGHLAASGRADRLYPAADASTFVGAAFDRAAHELLTSLPAHTVAIYMYSPLVAAIFAPLSYVGPNWSLLFWHLLSFAAWALSCKLLASMVDAKYPESLFLSSLFGPIFITLWSGQLGLVFGLLPLCVGLALLLRQRHLLAGLVWSILLLKPQYFPAAAFVALVFILVGNWRLAAGLALGGLIIIAANLLIFSPALVQQWLVSHRLSDALFTSRDYGIPVHLITSLPANLLLWLPSSLRVSLKWPIYLAALLCWAIGVAFCVKAQRSHWDMRGKTALSLAIGCLLSSFALPHLLYYDLCVLIPAGYLLLISNRTLPVAERTKAIAATAWLCISLYMPIALAYAPPAGVALLFEAVLAILIGALLRLILPALRQPNAV